MAQVNVDVDLNDFELEDIIEELKTRCFKSKYGWNHSKEIALKSLKEVRAAFGINDVGQRHYSLYDQMKIDFLMENLDNISLEKLESLKK